jgi:hypothetical protein
MDETLAEVPVEEDALETHPMTEVMLEEDEAIKLARA